MFGFLSCDVCQVVVVQVAGGQIFNIGKSKAKLFDEKLETKTTFEDVAGLEGAKEEIQEIVDFLKHPEKYTALVVKFLKVPC